MSSLEDRRAGGVQAAIQAAQKARAAIVLLSCVLLLAIAPAAFAQEVACGVIRWDPAAGPVVGYDVYVEINDSAASLLASSVPDTELAVSGPEFDSGDALRFQVVGVAADGRRGPPSHTSDVVFCGDVPTPQGLSAEDGSAVDPILVTWEPVPYADFYVVFRSTEPGVDGEYLDRSDEPFVEDDDAEVATRYYYSVSAVAGIQISPFSEQADALRGAAYPKLVASTSQLVFDLKSGQSSATKSLELTNVGDWELGYQAWPGTAWVAVSPDAGLLEGEPGSVNVTVRRSGLAPGVHRSSILFYTYHDAPPGESFELAPPLEVEVVMNVPVANRPPVVTSSLVITVAEGQRLETLVSASDPDGDGIDLVAAGLPAWASFTDLGGGTGTLVLTPGYDAAGSWTGNLHAIDDATPVAYVSDVLTLVVTDVNRGPFLAPIPDLTMGVDEVLRIPVSASDLDTGDRLAFMVSSLPGFASFVDHGDGTGEFVLAPGSSQVGSFMFIVVVVDDGDPPLSRAIHFQVTVEN